jgi:hypothetical protein
VPVCIVGDIFDRAVVSEEIKIIFLQFVDKVKKGVYVIAGNHCLPYHSWENVQRSSFGVILNSGKIHTLHELGMAAHFGNEITGIDNGIVFTHELVFERMVDVPPNVKAYCAQEMLDMYPKAKWIFTGDMHHNFHYEKKGRHVLNPGCINRQSADFINYQPIIYFVDTDLEQVIEECIPDNEKMVTDSYLREEEKREDRINAFIEGVKKSGHVSLSFVDNIEVALAKNKDLNAATVKMIHELVEEE